MGNFSSKSQLEVSFEKEKDPSQVCDGDPRSPSIDIDRTPIQQTISSANNKITKNMNLTKECFEKFGDGHLNPALRGVMNEFDPRSPTLDFERTPLAFLLRDPEWVAAQNNLNSSAILDVSVETHQVKELEPKNLCNELANLSVQSDGELATSENQSIKSDNDKSEVCDVSSTEESQQAPGLLETNFDYLETDVDSVRRQKCKEFNEKLKHVSVETKSDVIKLEVDGDTVVQEIIEQTVSGDLAYKDLSDKDPRSPSGGIDRTPILVAERESVTIETKRIKSSKKINSRVKEVLRNNAKMQKNALYQDMFKENDIKKDSLLIYEDNVENTPPVNEVRNVQLNSETSRTPLACMMNIVKGQTGSQHNTPIDSANKMSNIKSKIPIRVSKLTPNSLGEKGDVKNIKSRVINMDLENTPPRPRKACWDRDSSVVL